MLTAGQSNMEGAGLGPIEYRHPPDLRIRIVYEPSPGEYRVGDGDTDPLPRSWNGVCHGASPVASAARLIVRHLERDDTLVIVHGAVGSSGLHQWRPDGATMPFSWQKPDDPGNRLLPSLVNRLQWAVNHFNAELDVFGCLIQNGENEIGRRIKKGDDLAAGGVTTELFLQEQTDFVDALRSSVGCHFPITFGEPPKRLDQDLQPWFDLIPALRQLPEIRPDVAIVSAEGMTSNYGIGAHPKINESGHYSAQATVRLGVRHARALLRMRRENGAA